MATSDGCGGELLARNLGHLLDLAANDGGRGRGVEDLHHESSGARYLSALFGPAVTAPIIGARTLEQLTASLESEQLTLPDSIRSALDDVSAPEIGYPERLPWG